MHRTKNREAEKKPAVDPTAFQHEMTMVSLTLKGEAAAWIARSREARENEFMVAPRPSCKLGEMKLSEHQVETGAPIDEIDIRPKSEKITLSADYRQGVKVEALPPIKADFTGGTLAEPEPINVLLTGIHLPAGSDSLTVEAVLPPERRKRAVMEKLSQAESVWTPSLSCSLPKELQKDLSKKTLEAIQSCSVHLTMTEPERSVSIGKLSQEEKTFRMNYASEPQIEYRDLQKLNFDTAVPDVWPEKVEAPAVKIVSAQLELPIASKPPRQSMQAPVLQPVSVKLETVAVHETLLKKTQTPELRPISAKLESIAVSETLLKKMKTPELWNVPADLRLSSEPTSGSYVGAVTHDLLETPRYDEKIIVLPENAEVLGAELRRQLSELFTSTPYYESGTILVREYTKKTSIDFKQNLPKLPSRSFLLDNSLLDKQQELVPRNYAEAKLDHKKLRLVNVVKLVVLPFGVKLPETPGGLDSLALPDDARLVAQPEPLRLMLPEANLKQMEISLQEALIEAEKAFDLPTVECPDVMTLWEEMGGPDAVANDLKRIIIGENHR